MAEGTKHMKWKRGAALVAAIAVATPVAAQQGTTAQVADEGAPPKPIEGVAASYRTPVRDAAGYVTPNRELSPEETVWHVRVALNVAALGCRGADEGTTVAAYNALLGSFRAPLAAAAAGAEKRYQAKYGAKWRAAQDDRMTRLYNFFAQTPAHDEFCARAKQVLAAAPATRAEDWPRLAGQALTWMEAPFLAFYARYDAYRTERADWEARHTPPVVIAAAMPLTAVGPVTVAK